MSHLELVSCTENCRYVLGFVGGYLRESAKLKRFLHLQRSRNAVSGYAEWPQGMPWLYYGSDDYRWVMRKVCCTDNLGLSRRRNRFKWTWPSNQLLEAERIYDGWYTFFIFQSGKTHTMTFTAALYSLNGTFIGYTNVTDELQLCESKPSDARRWLGFGTSYFNKLVTLYL